MSMARAHVVMSDEVLNAVDARVGERGRSRFLEEAAKERLARLELGEALEAARGAAKGPAYAHWKDRRTSAAWVRDGRRSGRSE